MAAELLESQIKKLNSRKDMLTKLPYDFIKNTSINLTWQDIGFGVKNRYIDEYVPVSFAMEYVLKGEDNDVLVDLASLLPGEPVIDTLNKLIEIEGLKFDESMVKRKWLYLLLKFIYETYGNSQESLSLVEDVYAHFEYPESITSFVGYMPMVGDDLGSKEKNIARLFENWEAYINEEELFFVEKDSSAD